MEGSGSTAKNSTSLRRRPGPLDQSVRGSSTNMPFWPGERAFISFLLLLNHHLGITPVLQTMYMVCGENIIAWTYIQGIHYHLA